MMKIHRKDWKYLEANPEGDPGFDPGLCSCPACPGFAVAAAPAAGSSAGSTRSYTWSPHWMGRE